MRLPAKLLRGIPRDRRARPVPGRSRKTQDDLDLARAQLEPCSGRRLALSRKARRGYESATNAMVGPAKKRVSGLEEQFVLSRLWSRK
jgi:hypothetical protein